LLYYLDSPGSPAFARSPKFFCPGKAIGGSEF
jgi:hypothetical protein